MWVTILEKLLIPLVMKLGEFVYKKIEIWLEDKRITDKIKEDMKKVRDAKTVQEIRDAHTNSTRF
jgi:hypothetical protein